MSDTQNADDYTEQPQPFQPDQANYSRVPMPLRPSGMQDIIARVMPFLQPRQPQPRPQDFPQPGQFGGPAPPEAHQRGIAPLPPWAPPQSFPQPSFNAFVPSRPDRGHSEWGQPERFPQLPQAFEVPGMLGMLGKYFSQNGSMASMGTGANVAAFADAYSKAYMQGKTFLANQEREKLANEREKLQLQHEEMATTYSDTISEYEEASGHHGDLAGVGNYTINGLDLAHALAKDASDIGDTKLANVALTRGAEAAILMLKDRDARLRDLQRVNQKAGETENAEESWNQGGTTGYGGTGAGGGAQPAAGQQGVDPIAASAPAPGHPDVAPAQPSRPDVTPGPTDPASEDNKYALDPQRETWARGLSPAKKSMGVNMLMGTNPQGMPPGAKSDSEQYGTYLQDKMDKILSDPSLKNNQQGLLDAVSRNISPTVARELQNVMDYQTPVTGGGGGSGLAGSFLRRLQALAAYGKEGWQEQNYNAVQRFENDNAGVYNVIRRAGTATANGINLVEDVKRIRALPGGGRLTSKEILAKIAARGPDAAIYQQFWNDWKQYAQEITSLGIPGGSVTISRDVADGVPWYASPDVYLAVIKHHADAASTSVAGLQDRWNYLNTGRAMPGSGPMLKQAIDDLDHISRMDEKYGMLPGDEMTAKDGHRYRYTGTNKRNPDADENWQDLGPTTNAPP